MSSKKYLDVAFVNRQINDKIKKFFNGQDANTIFLKEVRNIGTIFAKKLKGMWVIMFH